MDNIEIREYDDKDKDAVDGFLSSRNDACIFQTPLYFEALKASGNKLARYFIAWRGGKVCGCLLCEIMTQKFDRRAIFSGILDIKGGPVAENNDAVIVRALLDAAKSIRPKAVYMQIAPVYDPAPIKDTLLSYGFEFRPHLVLQIDLTKSEEELNAAISKEKQKNIRKALRNSLTFTELEGANRWEVFTNIVSTTYKRLGIPAPELETYKALETINPDKIKIFGIFDSVGNLVSVQLILAHNKLAYCAVLGNLSEANKLHPNELSYYKTILWAKHNCYAILDMGGGGNPERPYGVRDFKMGFGPQAFNYGHYVLPLRPALMKIAKKTWYFLHPKR